MHSCTRELAARLWEPHSLRPFGAIVASPFVRCVQTACIVADALDVRVLVEPGLAEVDAAAKVCLGAEELARCVHCITASLHVHMFLGLRSRLLNV